MMTTTTTTTRQKNDGFCGGGGPPSRAAQIANGRRDRARCKSSNTHAPESATTGVRGNGRSVLARSERRRRRATPETRGRERSRERDDDAGNGSGVFRRGYTREIEENLLPNERDVGLLSRNDVLQRGRGAMRKAKGLPNRRECVKFIGKKKNPLSVVARRGDY